MNAEPISVDLPIEGIFHKLLLHLIKEDFTVLSSTCEALVADAESGETIAGEILALQIADKFMVAMAHFVFDTREGPVGPLKNVLVYFCREEGIEEFSFETAGLAKIIVSPAI